MRNLIIGSGITGLTIGKVLTKKKIGFKILESQKVKSEVRFKQV